MQPNYTEDGTETLTPQTEIIKFVECTVHPFDQSVIMDAFGIDPNATYDQFGIPYSEAHPEYGQCIETDALWFSWEWSVCTVNRC